MTSDPRAALDRLVAALEAHLQAASRRTGEADPAVVAAYQNLADAFETYDEALYEAYDEVTPFVLYEDAEDDEDDEEDEDDDGRRPRRGRRRRSRRRPRRGSSEDLELDLGSHDGATQVLAGSEPSG